jgi:hypothetical protein
MSGADKGAQQAALARLQELGAALVEQPDSASTAAARELLQLIFALHRDGLARLRELIGESPDGEVLLERVARDERTRALLLLHDLHPQDLTTRAAAAIGGLRPHLAVYGIRVERFSVSGHALKLTLHETTAPGVRPPPAEALRGEIEAAVYELAPDLESIVIDGLPVPAAYVPLSQLSRPAKAAAGPG